MHAVDTNVIVRYLIADHPDQFARANSVMGKRPVYVPPTVLVETAWVLGSTYKFDRIRVVDALRALLGLPGVDTSDPAEIDQALAWYEQGLDFADAMHLALSIDVCEGLLTFDRAFLRDANRFRPGAVSEP